MLLDSLKLVWMFSRHVDPEPGTSNKIRPRRWGVCVVGNTPHTRRQRRRGQTFTSHTRSAICFVVSPPGVAVFRNTQLLAHASLLARRQKSLLSRSLPLPCTTGLVTMPHSS